MVLPGTFRVGPLRFPVFGVFATAGLLGAMALSQRTAKKAGVSPEKLWDAAIVGVVLAFFLSRLELVLSNWTAFRAMPALVLSLPSISYTGLLLTVVLVGFFLRWKGVSILRAMDAWAPCAMVLWASLSLGHFVEGTDAGMPTTMPWGVVAAGDTVLGKTHPVQLYAVVAALTLIGFLWWRLGRRVGQMAGLGMLLGGVVSFALDFLRQPVVGYPVDPSQVVAAIVSLLGGCLLLSRDRTHRITAGPRDVPELVR